MVSRALLPALRARLAGSSTSRLAEEAAERAAVAVILLPRADMLEVLLIRRADRPGDHWSGHMAFPGGRRSADDRDLLATAIRETKEEVGLDLTTSGDLLGALEAVPAVARGKKTGMVVAPYVFVLHEEPVLSPNHEVVEVLWGRLASMIDGSIDTTIDYAHEGVSIALPGYLVGERIVWGLTHRMLGLLFDEIRQCAMA